MVHAKLPWRSKGTFPNQCQPISHLTDMQAPTIQAIKTLKIHTQTPISCLCYTYPHTLPTNTLTDNKAPNNPFRWLRGGLVQTHELRSHLAQKTFLLGWGPSLQLLSKLPWRGGSSMAQLQPKAPAVTLLNPALAGWCMHNQHQLPAQVPSSFCSELGHLCSDYLSLLTTLL